MDAHARNQTSQTWLSASLAEKLPGQDPTPCSPQHSKPEAPNP